MKKLLQDDCDWFIIVSGEAYPGLLCFAVPKKLDFAMHL